MLPMDSACVNQGEIILTGELTIRRAAEIRKMLLVGIEANALMTIRIGEATDIDPSFLQLLCSAHRSAGGKGHAVILDAGDSSHFQQQLRDAGFIRHIGCLLDCRNSCIWVEPNQMPEGL